MKQKEQRITGVLKRGFESPEKAIEGWIGTDNPSLL